MKIIVTTYDPDGFAVETDITEGVQVAYDTAHESLNWGSGFLDLDEMEAITKLGEACRFPDFADAVTQVQAQREHQERQQAIVDRREQERRREVAAAQETWQDLLPELTSSDWETVQAARVEAERRVDEFWKGRQG